MTTGQPHTSPAADILPAYEPTTALQSGYLLIDPAALPGDVPLAELPVSRCIPTNWGADLTGLPIVVDLVQCDTTQQVRLGCVLLDEHDRRKPVPLMRAGVCGHLTASVSCAEVAMHLAHQLLVLPVDATGYRSGVPSLWRIFDPRVFANLGWMLNQDQQRALLGPISAWAFPWFDYWFTLDRTRAWQPNADDSHGALSAHPKPIEMDTWERVQRIAQINQVHACFSLPCGSTWEQRVALAKRIESALATAKYRLHWHRSEDQTAYAEHVVRYGDAFANHPKLTAYWLLREECKASGDWSEATERLTADDYQALQTRQPSTDGGDVRRATPSGNF